MLAFRMLGALLALFCLSFGEVKAMSTTTVTINLRQSGLNDVRIEVSGSGTVIDGAGNNPGTVLDFLNFSPGNPFAQDLDFDQADVTGLLVNGVAPSIRFDDGGDSGSDIDFVLPSSLTTGDSFVFSGSAILSGISFSDLFVGKYTASTSVGDAEEFGGVALNVISSIVPVPEPGSLLLIALGGCCALAGGRCKRSRQ